MTRRRSLAALAGFAGVPRLGLAAASQPSIPVSFSVPAHACDCHTHIFGPPDRFPLWSGRTYTPEAASPEEMAALHQALHIERVVIVTPSVYGVDNSAMLYGLKARGRSARGIAVIGDQTTDRDLDTMDRAGVRGIRLNLATLGQKDPAIARRRLQAAIGRVRPRGWHVQIFVDAFLIPSLKTLVQDSAVPVVFDHFGGAKATAGLAQAGFPDLLDLLRSGHAYVKVSAAHRISAQLPDCPDVLPLAKALVAANPDRVLWGTDWPHPDSNPPASRPISEVSPLLKIDDARLLNLLPAWAHDPAIRQRILVDNPARLYGFL
ncbi:MAG: amidohydrolase family protein [Bryobacteraceae bacterium]